jgi:hypothetical protein
MKNILTAMRECDAILQTLIHDIGSHQVQAADLAIRLRTAANLLDPPECPGSVSRPHGMFQTVVQRSTVPDDSDDAGALRAQLQQELDRSTVVNLILTVASERWTPLPSGWVTGSESWTSRCTTGSGPSSSCTGSNGTPARRGLLFRFPGRRAAQAHLCGGGVRTLSDPNILSR